MNFSRLNMKRTLLASILFFSVALHGTALELFVSPIGKPQNTGTRQSPLDFATALEKIKANAKNSLSHNGDTISLLAGRYYFTESYKLATELKGNQQHPIVIRAYTNEVVVFDGGKMIDPNGFSNVTDSKELARLAESARGKIVAKTLTDKALIEKLSSEVIQILSLDKGVYLPSRFPNSGYALLKNNFDVAEISPPGITGNTPSQRAGNPPFQEPGRPPNWTGSIDEPRGAQVGIGERENEMAGTWQQWQDELKRNNKRNLLSGFLDAHWKLRSQGIYAASAENKNLHLSSALSYGWGGNAHKEFKVFGLLCEIDKPGEWHFDVTTNRLYIYPTSSINEKTLIGIPFSTGFMEFEGASYVSIIGLRVENVGAGSVFNIKSGDHNLIAGCLITNSTAQGVSLLGHHNGVLSCDLIDLKSHVGISGGVRSPTEITAAFNYVENCHFYQKHFSHEKVNISMTGVGNIFRNNLIHNSLGQPMIVNGNDQLIERNEFFNVGYDEGDGGAVYSGADLAGYGNVYRHNFFHHLMNVPGKVQRAGIHLDDLQAGSLCEGNVFYKSASKGVFMFGGAGHVVRDNVNLEGGYGVYNVANGSRKNNAVQSAILKNPRHNLVDMKENYVGNAEKRIGSKAWESELWKTKYPRFYMIMSDTGEYGRIWPIRNVVENNLFYGNARGDSTVWSRFEPAARSKSILKNDRVITPDYFENYKELDLRFKKGLQNVPKIPFEEIGLYTDPLRTTMPDKHHYRKVIKAFFEGTRSDPGTKLKINTAEVIENGPFVK
jgi:Right handed beta helix region